MRNTKYIRTNGKPQFKIFYQQIHLLVVEFDRLTDIRIVYKYNCYIFMLNYVDFHFILFRLYEHPILGSKS